MDVKSEQSNESRHLGELEDYKYIEEDILEEISVISDNSEKDLSGITIQSQKIIENEYIIPKEKEEVDALLKEAGDLKESLMSKISDLTDQHNSELIKNQKDQKQENIQNELTENEFNIRKKTGLVFDLPTDKKEYKQELFENRAEFIGKLEKGEWNNIKEKLQKNTGNVVKDLLQSMTSKHIGKDLDWKSIGNKIKKDSNILDIISEEAEKQEINKVKKKKEFRRMKLRAEELNIRSEVLDKNYELTLDFLINKISDNLNNNVSSSILDKENVITEHLFLKLQEIIASKKTEQEFKSHQEKLEEFYSVDDLKNLEPEDLKVYLSKIQKSSFFRKNEKQIANIILWITKKKLKENKIEELLEDVTIKISKNKNYSGSWREKIAKALKSLKINKDAQSMIQLLVLTGILTSASAAFAENVKGGEVNKDKQGIELISNENQNEDINSSEVGKGIGFDQETIKEVVAQIKGTLHDSLDVDINIKDIDDLDLDSLDLDSKVGDFELKDFEKINQKDIYKSYFDEIEKRKKFSKFYESEEMYNKSSLTWLEAVEKPTDYQYKQI
ncbi:hypothetical protein K8R66_04015, partial [bacterium]|nr:hypothetical protein [bacterium]